MPKTVFVDGTEVDPEFLNAINNPVFVTTADQDGQIAKIRDADLSDSSDQIKAVWNTFRNTLLVSAGTGLSVDYTGGVVMLTANTITTVAPGSVALANNATNFIFVDAAGVVQAATSQPVFCLPLAQVTTVAGAISGAIIDQRPRFRILPRPAVVKVFGGNGDQGDYTLNSGSDTFTQGEYYYRNFTIGAGATLNISGGGAIIRCENFTCNGSIVVAQSPGTGGRGVSRAFNTTTGLTDFGNNGTGYGAGFRQLGGGVYNYLAQGGGSGGASGTGQGAAGEAMALASGGDGGGFLIVECARSIAVGGTATIQARGANGANPTATTGAPIGGGGGAGSGGLVALKAGVSVSVAGTIDLRGGVGGNALNGTSTGAGGGGGGGTCVLIAPTISTVGATINLAGGAAGTQIGAGAAVNGGGGGGFGGAGGLTNAAGSAGSLIQRSFVPVG